MSESTETTEIIGNNSIVLNEATMYRALEFWFSHKLFKGQDIKVTSMHRDTQNHSFKIGISDGKK